MKSFMFLVCVLAPCAPAFAQAFNIDIGANTLYALPSPTFGAGAGQAGVWNNVPGTPSTTSLVDVDGAPTPVSIRFSGFSQNYQTDNVALTGDDAKLMNDAADPIQPGTWKIEGLAAGDYVVYTYAWAPDSAQFTTLVSVTGSSDPTQTVGGAWPNGYVLGITHALHHISISAGGQILINIGLPPSSPATLNGIQIVPGVSQNFCVPGVSGVSACPCANPNGANAGCGNTASSGGSLVATGVPSLGADSVLLTASSMYSGTSCIFLQGDAPIGAGSTFGAGIRCAGGSLKRLFTKPITVGVASAPTGADPSVSARSSSLGDTISPGATRYYQTYYRDPHLTNPGGTCPSIATFNITSGFVITWSP